ncbi:hypothetical protein K1719_036048 [Acacia pycnantha]|nr:hypothetical protein K1719_036048 [Acacia pycnantha]
MDESKGISVPSRGKLLAISSVKHGEETAIKLCELPAGGDGLGKESERRAAADVGDEGTGSDSAKPSFVRFPKTRLVVPPPLETEVEESSKTSNPVILWQVMWAAFTLGQTIQ